MVGATKCPCGAARRISGRSPYCAVCALQRRRKRPLKAEKRHDWSWYRKGLWRQLKEEADARIVKDVKSSSDSNNLLTPENGFNMIPMSAMTLT